MIVHVIFNLPGESRDDMLETVRYLSNMEPGPDGIKLQMLQILEGTDLIAPLWSLDKKRVLNTINRRIKYDQMQRSRE